MITIDEHERLGAERGQQICAACGYGHYTRGEHNRDAALKRFLLMYGILADLTEWGCGDR